jgi:hypothetical protein
MKINRELAIELLTKIGCKDLTDKMHPNKDKKYFRYYIGKSSWVNFNIDYPEYDRLFVSANKRFYIQDYVKFDDLPSYLIKHKIIKPTVQEDVLLETKYILL